MPTGHYPFAHRGSVASVLWDWPSKPLPTGWTDDWVSANTIYGGVFSNVINPSYIPPVSPLKQVNYNLVGPSNPSLPSSWQEYGQGTFFPGPSYGGALVTISHNPFASPTTQERPRRRNETHDTYVTFNIFFTGGAFDQAWPNVNNIRYQTHWVFNTTFIGNYFGNDYASVGVDPAKVMTISTPPTMLRIGDETFQQLEITQNTTPYRYGFAAGARYPSLITKNGIIPPAVDQYYSNEFAAIESYMSSQTTIEMVLRIAALPATYPGNLNTAGPLGIY